MKQRRAPPRSGGARGAEGLELRERAQRRAGVVGDAVEVLRLVEHAALDLPDRGEVARVAVGVEVDVAPGAGVVDRFLVLQRLDRVLKLGGAGAERNVGVRGVELAE